MENPINTFHIEVKDEFESSFNQGFFFQSFVLSFILLVQLLGTKD